MQVPGGDNSDPGSDILWWEVIPNQDIALSQNLPATFPKLSSSWLVQPSSAELRFVLILVITTPPTRDSSFDPLPDYLGS